MTVRQLKFGYFALAALNTLATSYFFTYLFFLLHDRFGFDNRQNLWVSALHGFIYIFAAWQCGRFAQHYGLVRSLKIGFGGLAAVMAAGALLDSTAAIIVVLIGYSIVLLFTWPALEALVSEKETQAGVQHQVGVYNCTWAGAAALAYFTGGPLYDACGRVAVFHIPAAIFTVQWLGVLWLARQTPAAMVLTAADPDAATHAPEPAAFRQAVRPEGFLKMAWLANPFAYVAINTVWAVMPGVAEKLELSPTRVGLFCSVWLFGRFAAFVWLWRWTGWHYRFRWLLAAFVVLIAGFVAMLTTTQLWLVIVGQAFFGLATGLIYYSSLFYSMDAGDTKGEHGGLHEAAIGAGICAGPAVGAAALQFGPQRPGIGVGAVSALLVAGLLALLIIRQRYHR